MGGPSPADVSKLSRATPLLFGPLINWTLYGVLCIQIYVYSYNFPNDKLALKLLGEYSTLVDALTAADLHYWFIQGFGNVERLKDSHYAPIDIAIMHSIISLIVQEYFCYRIWTLNKRLSWLCVIIAISVVLGRYAVSKPAYYLWSLPSAFADILIAIAMTALLRQTTRVDSEGQFPNYVLLRVVRLTIETNTLTAGVAIASFVLYVAFPDEIYYTFTYSNTLLVSLNNRIYFRDHPFSGVRGSTRCFVDSGRSRRSAVSSLTIAQPVLHHTGSIGDRLANPGMKVIDIGKSAVIEDSPDPRSFDSNPAPIVDGNFLGVNTNT
ncbi:hypothetical protein DFH94DRAFT_685127 [Russula ochroleuca]|uniref:DUF6534 domain-containing protein n=1 Tax=Russula ochroleuca TaxID=152965 RepID=A0A9P5JYG0_9AGAM|nr:hypothetical protein DFH94DRAFT_685127 [Russula ochroleuca]